MDLTGIPEQLSSIVSRTGPYAPVVLFGASFIEYVFPPFPGDLLVLIGAWYVVQGAISWPLAFVAVTVGAILGALLDWRLGRFLGERLRERAAPGGGLLSTARLERFEAAYRRWGPWLLVVNRFLPTLRAFIFLAAGASGVRARDVLLFGGISAALWNLLLLGAGGLLAKNLDQLVNMFRHYTEAASIALVAVAALVGLRFFLRRRARGHTA